MKHRKLGVNGWLGVFGMFSLVAAHPAFAQQPATAPAANAQPKRVEVKELKKQYWSQEEDVDVVQNRVYSKAKRMEFGLLGGSIFTDPFLSVSHAGVSLGYHFTEYLSAQLMYWKYFSSSSQALKTLEAQTGATTNTNPPKSFMGAEVGWNFIYGKLSLLGKAILYYDFHVLLGGGQTDTESGKNVALHAGVGQQIYLSKLFAIRMDYRLMRYSENIIEKVNPITRGQIAEKRTNYSNVITLGISLFFL